MNKRIGLASSSNSKPPVLEYKDGTWRLWTAYNPDLSKGTYFLLGNTGICELVTIAPDETLSIQRL